MSILLYSIECFLKNVNKIILAFVHSNLLSMWFKRRLFAWVVIFYFNWKSGIIQSAVLRFSWFEIMQNAKMTEKEHGIVIFNKEFDSFCREVSQADFRTSINPRRTFRLFCVKLSEFSSNKTAVDESASSPGWCLNDTHLCVVLLLWYTATLLNK